jgi:hypothetical protein
MRVPTADLKRMNMKELKALCKAKGLMVRRSREMPQWDVYTSNLILDSDFR